MQTDFNLLILPLRRNSRSMKIIECPRDAMQGIEEFIPTELKANYINQLLECGFDTIDFGSFVSPKAIPQLADTREVLELLDLSSSESKLLAIIANERGANDACRFEQINYLGFPFSVSPTFQMRNTNATQEQAIDRIKRIQELAINNNKEMVVYLSMAFGNPYEDEWSLEAVEKWVDVLAEIEIPILALADTVGVAKPDTIQTLFKGLIPKYKTIEFGAHFHSHPSSWEEKVQAAASAGCDRFDSSMKGIGGCPMAKDELVGNIATEHLLMYMGEQNVDLDDINQEAVLESLQLAKTVFPH